MSGQYLSYESWDDACLVQTLPPMIDYCCALRISRIWAFDNEHKGANADYIRTGRHILSDPCGVTSRSGTFVFEKGSSGRLYLYLS
jgi:hypothetical protein